MGNHMDNDSEDYDSNVYNSADSFIADEEDSMENSSDDEDFDPVKNTKAKVKMAGLTKDEVQMANDNIKKTRNRRLKKMKDTVVRSKDDFLVEEDDGDKRQRQDSGDEERHDTYHQQNLDDGLGQHQDLLQNIFNDDMFADDLETNDQTQDKDKKGNEDFSKMLPPEEQQKYFLTEMDQKIKKKDIPERLQIRFEGRQETVPEEMVLEATWIARKLMKKNNLADQLEASLIIKVYGVLENLLWKNQEIMYIWMYSRQDITTNMYTDSSIENNYEMTLDDLWFIYFADEEWQKCSEMKVNLAKLMKLLNNFEPLQGLAKMAFDNAMDIENLTACNEYLKFRLKCYIDEDEIEEKLEENSNTGKGII
jgi:transcription elongation factor SPT6